MSGSPKQDAKPDRGLSKDQRLHRSRDFQTAYAQKQNVHGRFMVLWRLSQEDASLKLGVVASKRVGNAPHRARAKRLLREIFRLNRFRLAGDVDVVLVARRAIIDAPYADIEKDFLKLAQNSGLLAETAE